MIELTNTQTVVMVFLLIVTHICVYVWGRLDEEFNQLMDNLDEIEEDLNDLAEEASEMADDRSGEGLKDE